MSKAFIFRPKPKEFRADPVEGIDLTHPVGVETEMYFHAGDDEHGNPIFEQVGVVNYLDSKDKTKFDVTYDVDFEGPRDYESDESKKSREEYLSQKKAQEEAYAAAADETEKEKANDEGEVQSGTDEESADDDSANDGDSGSETTTDKV